jgi:hypothetical protein
MKTYYILSHSSESEFAVDRKEVLKMSISILLGHAIEWALLHYVDESRFKFEATISDVHFWTSPNVGTGQSSEIIDAPPGSHQCGLVWRWLSLKFGDNLRRGIRKILVKKALSETSLSEILYLNGNWPVNCI